KIGLVILFVIHALIFHRRSPDCPFGFRTGTHQPFPSPPPGQLHPIFHAVLQAAPAPAARTGCRASARTGPAARAAPRASLARRPAPHRSPRSSPRSGSSKGGGR